MAGDQASTEPAEPAGAGHEARGLLQVEALQGETAAVAGGQFGQWHAQGEVGGGPLWLRAEPDFDAGQADALAALIKADLA